MYIKGFLIVFYVYKCKIVAANYLYRSDLLV